MEKVGSCYHGPVISESPQTLHGARTPLRCSFIMIKPLETTPPNASHIFVTSLAPSDSGRPPFPPPPPPPSLFFSLILHSPAR